MSGASWWDDFGGTRGETSTGTVPPSAPEVLRPGRPPRSPRSPRGLQVAAAVLTVVLLVMLGLLAARTLASTGSASGSAEQPVAGTPGGPTAGSQANAVSAASPTTGTAAADAAAVGELESLRQQGLAAHPPTGQWVAQLAAKSVGTTDPGQTADNGSSTFYASDILAQSRQIASGIAGGDVFVLQTTDFGEGLVDARGNPYWVTLAAGPFADAEDVQAWCDSVFSSTPAAERGNVCLPKQLAPRS